MEDTNDNNNVPEKVEEVALIENAIEEHPLQPESVEDSTLLDNQGRPNLSPSESSISQLEQPKEQILDTDTSHIKGFYNVADSSDILDLTVEGKLPEWLLGEHYTVGPGVYDVRYSRKIEVEGVLQSATSTFTLGHWFDALPLVNRFDLDGQRNTVTYRHRLVNKRLIEKIRDHHGYAPQYPAGLFKTNSNQTMLIKFLNNGKKPKPDRVPCGQRITTQLPGIEGRLFCQNLANHIQELDPIDLKPMRVETWDEVNPEFKGYSASPHGQYDPNTGEYINFTMEIGYRSTKYHFFSISEADPKGSTIATIWNAPTGWTQQFCLTPNYIVMIIHPMLANTGAVKFSWSESILDSFDFYPSEPTLFYVISRQAKDVIACYRSNASFSFNQANAFEDIHGNVVVDLASYQDDAIAHQLSTEMLRQPEKMGRLAAAELRRYTLNQPQHDAHQTYVANNSFIPSAVSITSRVGTVWNYVTGSTNLPENAIGSSGWHAWMPVVDYEKLTNVTLELPTINPDYKMKPYSFVYGLAFKDNLSSLAVPEGKLWDSIVKLDINDRKVVASWHQEHCYPSEAQFIPKSGDKSNQEEDAGALVSIVMDSARATSFLLVLDAKDLQVLAKVELNKLIPLSFGRGCYKPRML
ncbi:Beta,beta-carotene 9',10'-oxygenase [Choanephora cucurbitarum]|uniref:Beta,beta-carotene 9',10'-oxygenase n=1 Tax=Choanephora cucurbitarum TaxID=101091 RepID=A0A1C7NCZ3_9FUNG|nr:Beta,beta-carotene 9',10'-oxygenase [Choanephora cucurbitarum]